MSPPSKLFRLEWLEGVGGYPKYREKVRRHRNYESPSDLAKQLAMIDALQPYCELIALYEGDITWKPLDRAKLPEMEPSEATQHLLDRAGKP